MFSCLLVVLSTLFIVSSKIEAADARDDRQHPCHFLHFEIHTFYCFL